MRRALPVVWLVACSLLFSACLDVAVTDGRFGCRSASECPTDWVCRMPEQRCYASSVGDTGGLDGAIVDASHPDATVDAGRDASAAIDAARDVGPTNDAFVPRDAPMIDAPAADTGRDACTVDVASTCAGRCNSVTDARCGVLIDCGNPCVLPATCGGGGPTFCGCVADAVSTTCSGHCGPVTNNCGTSVDCGNTCGGSDTCGGGGVPHVCGCTPTGNACSGTSCGTSVDSCGDTVHCDTCFGTRPVCHLECEMCLSTTASCP